MIYECLRAIFILAVFGAAGTLHRPLHERQALPTSFKGLKHGYHNSRLKA
jgi:hypothetical protein